ncbi:MAG: DUF5685 family protein, partial [Lachnospiraceae bacterium]|nr:DUF5685 family protein [Lachnospiraceae bacterium]
MKGSGEPMFGYVVANQAMLAKEETAVYASFYCGLCHELGKQYGWIGRMTLNYDLTFLLLLLTALYEPQEFQKTIRCAAHPFKRKTIRTNEITTYIAQMNMILSYEKCADDWMDDRSITAYLRKNMIGAKIAVDKSDTHDTGSAAHAAGRKNEDSASREPSETNENFMLREHERINKKTEHIRSCLLEIHQIERERKPDLDAASGVFGQLLAEIVCYRQDVWREALSGLGFHLGKFIYLVDAYEDLESDI